MPRSPLLSGFLLTLRHPRPLLWVYAANVAIPLITFTGLRLEFSDLTRASLASGSMINGFDLGSFASATGHIAAVSPGAFTIPFLAIPLYLLVVFLLTPGTILTYRTGESLSLGSLLQTGAASFWSFVRIFLLAALISGPILGVLAALRSLLLKHVNLTLTGRPAFLLGLAATGVLFLVANFLRLYFDLVEVHTVDLAATHNLPNLGPDRRIRSTLKPAWRTLTFPFWLVFTALTLLGCALLALFSFSALHHLGQPRSWPMFLLAQLGLFMLLFTRFWQRAAETVHVANRNPVLSRSSIFAPQPIPSPEPIAPSLPEPDPAVFHHDVPPPGELLN